MGTNSIYHIEDITEYRKPLYDYCKKQGIDYHYFGFEKYDPTTNQSFVELILQDISECNPDIVVLDLAWDKIEEGYFEKLLSSSTLETIDELKKQCQVFSLLNELNLNQKFLPIIILTLYSKEIHIVFEQVYGKRADYIIKQKPNSQSVGNYEKLFNDDISKCLEAKIFLNQVNNLLISASLSNINLYSQIMKASAQDVGLLILGQTGVGKTVLARAIHSLSKRFNDPFIEVDCTLIPKELMESELFGHEKGSFTGATTKKIGKVELANKGTIFLDEIGELSLELQKKLLSFLETNSSKFYRVGGNQLFSTDVRVIAATNKNLLEEVRTGRFREDLFFRLNIYPIKLPSLNDRISDIPLLVQGFYKLYTKIYSKTFRELTLSEIEPFLYINYRGNIKQLQNIIERAIIKNINPISQILKDKDTVEELLVDKSNADNNIEEVLNKLFEYALKNSIGINDITDLVEKYFYENILQMYNYNKSKASARLNLNDDTFRKRCKILGIKLNSDRR